MPEQTPSPEILTPDTAPVPTDTNPHRLPRTVVPRRYDLTLEPDLEAASFAGHEVVAVEVLTETSEVVLNAVELEIDEATAEVPGAGGGLAASVTLDDEAERATLTFDRPLPAGDARLRLRFRGVLNDKLRGFYRSTFTDSDGVERVLAVTQMEATDARRAFPCWDEPDAKAVFGVTLVVPEDLLAISNAAELERTPAGEAADGTKRVAIRFADTMPMSTYLVAFVVGPLVATDPLDVDGNPLRVVCPIGKEHLATYALEVGAFALRYLSDWFGIVYPGDKLDLVAIPDFAFGAMENVGCVTFRERYVLVDPATSTQYELQAVVDVIAHEIAHMWFGDLVTMRWWNGIWLNEAFATFMETTCTDAFRPDWQRWVDFGLSRSAAFDTDALEATRPIEYPVVSPADADGMFDVLTYEKGASVVRMLEQHLGPDRFRHGIRRYMARHQYGNTETSDLWDALEAETGEPVRRIAESWIFQRGFPEVGVEAGAADTPTLRLTQRRFRYAGDDGRGPASQAGDDGTAGHRHWSVPLAVESRGEAPAGAAVGAGGMSPAGVDRVLLDGEPLELERPAGTSWVNANAGAHGFYRVRYAEPLLTALLDHLGELTPLERYTLVDDAWASVLAAATAAPSFVETVERLVDETDLSVWERIVGGLGQLERLVEDGVAQRLHTRVATLVGPARARLGPDVDPEGDDDRTRSLRGLLLQTAALLGDDGAARERSNELLDAYLADPAGVDPSMATAALVVSATLGDEALHDRLVERFRVSDNPQDRERLLLALSRFREPGCLRRTLDMALSGAVRTQDAPYLLRETLTNRDNGPAAFAFVAERWSEITERFPANSIPRLVSGVRAVRNRALAEQVVAFLADHPIPQGALQVRQHIERMRVTVALAERESARFAAYLSG
ncbi:MAG: M1 family metallopeptidase [Acidimicrobiales bacterium]